MPVSAIVPIKNLRIPAGGSFVVEAGATVTLPAENITAKVTVADQTARFALTTAEVQNGDTVFQIDTSTLFLVTDQTALNGSGGYTALATVTLAQVSDMSADARTRNTKTDAEIKTLLSSIPPFDAGNKTGNATFAVADGLFQKAALTGNITLQLPTGGTEGMQLKLWLTASGADRTFDKVAGIALPSDSGLSLPKTLASGKRYRVLLECYDATHWDLVSFVGGH